MIVALQGCELIGRGKENKTEAQNEKNNPFTTFQATFMQKTHLLLGFH